MSMQECVDKRKCKFLANYVKSDNILCYICQNTAEHEQYVRQTVTISSSSLVKIYLFFVCIYIYIFFSFLTLISYFVSAMLW